MAQIRRTGQFGGVYFAPDGTVAASGSTVMTLEPCTALTGLPGDDTAYTANLFYKITAVAHSIIDPDQPVTVYANAIAVSPNNYVVHFGSGIIEFFTANAGPVTVTGNYIPNAGLLVKAGETKDWTFTVTSADVDGASYGTGFGSHFAGIANGTFGFTKFQTELALFQKFRSGSRLVMFFYESVRAPSYWVVFGRLLSHPNAAPIAGMVMGQLTGTLLQYPDFRNDSVG